MPLTNLDNPLGRDVLSRYICNTLEEAIIDSEGIDVVVLGSGMYGGYCASKIHELSKIKFGAVDDNTRGRSLRALVLEAGPFLVPEHGQNIPNLGLPDVSIFDPQDLSSGSNPQPRAEVWGAGWRSNQKFPGQAYCVGGKSIYWGGWCPRLQAVDLAKWPEPVRRFLTVVNKEEPVGIRPIEHKDPTTGKLLERGEPLSGYEAVEYEIGVMPSDDFVFDPVDLSSGSLTPKPQVVGLNAALLHFLTTKRATIDARLTEVLSAPIAVQTQSFISGLFGLDKYSSVPAMTASARADHSNGRSDLRFAIVPRCHVVRLLCAEDAEAPEVGTRRVDRIEVIYEGQKKTIALGNHCQIVLAMSCIESTRLALESFSLADSKLKAARDELIGRNYMVHLRTDVSFKVERSRFATFVSTTWPGKQLADELQLASLHLQCEGTHGTYHFQFYAATNRDGPDTDMFKMIPDIDIQRGIAEGFDSNKISIVLRICAETKGGRLHRLRTPGFDYIDLAGDADFDTVFKHRRAWVQFNGTGGGDHVADLIWQEMHDTAHSIRIALQLGGADDFKAVSTNQFPGSQTTDYSRNALARQQGPGTTFHDSGTLWMGDSPDDDVCDSNGHLHHMTNVYAADQSLFPTVGSANPVLTGVCLARMVAENIVSRHGTNKAQDGALAGFAAISFARSRGWLTAPRDGISNFGETIVTKPGNGIGLYYLPEEIDDFELYVEWKAFRTPDFPNAGILLRAPDPVGVNFDNPTQFDAYYDATTEIQIDELGKNFVRNPPPGRPKAIFGDSRYKTGAVYGLEPATQWAATVIAPDGADTAERYWNTYQISATGNQVVVKLNGKIVCDCTLPPSKRAKGFLGFQFHTGRVQFRNLRLRK